MKKFTKALGVGLLMIPCVFALTACGPKGEQWDNVELQTVEDYVKEANTDLMSSKGLRIVASMTEQEGNNAEVRSTSEILAVNGEFKMSYTDPSDADYVSGTTWFKDHKLYTKALPKDATEEEKYYVPFDVDLAFLMGQAGLSDFNITFTQVLDMVKNLEEGKYTIQKTEDSTNIKYRVTINAEAMAGVFGAMSGEEEDLADTEFSDGVYTATFKKGEGEEKNTLTGVKFSYGMSSKETDKEGHEVVYRQSGEMEISVYEGTIEFPEELSSYPLANMGGQE